MGFVFYPFLNEVKKMYEERTGEQIQPIEDWSDNVQQKFFECFVKKNVKEFVDFVLKK